MNFDAFLEEIQQRTGLTSQDGAVQVMEATMEVLGTLLGENDRRELVAHLPDELAYSIQRGMPGQDFDLDEFYERVGDMEGVSSGFGLEHAQTVCKVLNRHLSADERVFLRKRLPESVATLFDEPSEQEIVPIDEQLRVGPGLDSNFESFEERERGHGPRHPNSISEEAGQRNSIARSSNPREGTKLSSGRVHSGPGGDLSSGRGGSDSSLSDFGLDFDN